MNRTRIFAAALSIAFVACGTTPAAEQETGLPADTANDVVLDTPDTEPDLVVVDVDLDAPPMDIEPRDVEPSDAQDVSDTSGVGCPDGPEWLYESDDPAFCEEVALHCEFPGTNFANECGCGCFFPRTLECPYDELGPLYQEVGASPEDCAAIFFGCEDGGEMVQDECGCGCVYGPPVCLDPEAPGVSYVGLSPQMCQLIDYDCGGAGYFDNPCGCGCIEELCPSGPAIDYVATSADECAVIDFGCPDGWTGFDAGECGCGCEIASCPTDEFLPPSGLASEVELGGFCDFLVACYQFPLSEVATTDSLLHFYADIRCREGSSSGCPLGTESICEVPLGMLSAQDMANACTVAEGTPTIGMLCSGDR